MANHKENEWEFKGQIFKVKPGQFVTSLDGIKEECANDVSIQNIRTALLKLEKWGFLTNESTKTGRLITVVNWEVYQSQSEDQQSDSQTANKELTPNKNVKNDKEELLNDDDNNDSFFSDLDSSVEQPLELEIENYYQSKRRKVGFPVKQVDLEAIQTAIQEFTKDEIIEGINHAFATAGSVNSFSYCLKVMQTQKEQRDRWNQMKKGRTSYEGKKKVQQHPGSTGVNQGNVGTQESLAQRANRAALERLRAQGHDI